MTEKFCAYDNGEQVWVGIDNGKLGGEPFAVLWDHRRPNATDASYHVATRRARIMASASDLLTALKDATARLEGFIESDCECDNTHEQNGTVCALCSYHAAIAKAESR